MNKLWRSQKGGKWLVWDGEGLRREGSDFPLAAPIDTFITVGNVEEKVLFMVLLGHKAKYTFVSLTMSREAFSQMRNRSCKKKVPDTIGPWWPRWVE